MKPIPRTWKYKGPEVAGEYLKVKRFQLPLAPANALSLYSMQGMTADPGLIAHWVSSKTHAGYQVADRLRDVVSSS